MPALSVQAISNKPGFFVVASSDGKRCYEVHARGRQCDCADWTYRQSERAGLCKHVLAVLAYLEEQDACSQCGGKGFHIASFQYASGSEPLACSCCSGTGRRENADPRLLELADRFNAEQRDRELKGVFA